MKPWMPKETREAFNKSKMNKEDKEKSRQQIDNEKHQKKVEEIENKSKSFTDKLKSLF